MPNLKVNYYSGDIDCIFKPTKSILSLSPVKDAVEGYHGKEIIKNLWADDYKIRMTKIIYDMTLKSSEVTFELENLDYYRHGRNGDYCLGCITDVKEDMIIPLFPEYLKPKEANINYPVVKNEYYLWWNTNVDTYRKTFVIFVFFRDRLLPRM